MIELVKGSKPYLIIAPHGGGPTDIRSALMARIITKQLDAFAVINTGWIRSPQEDLENGIANLNDLRHCRQKPLNRDFLRPIEEYKKFILTKSKKAYLFIIHGMNDKIRDYNGVNIVVGYGHGDPPRHTSTLTFKDRFISCLDLEKFNVAQGKAGGRLSAWDSHNLNQLYAKDESIFSLQLEIALTLRDNDTDAKETAVKVAAAIERACSVGSVQFLKNIPER